MVTRRRWTESDREIALDPSLSVAQVAKKLGRTPLAIRTFRSKNSAVSLNGGMPNGSPALSRARIAISDMITELDTEISELESRMEDMDERRNALETMLNELEEA